MAPRAVVAAPPLVPPRFGLIVSARDASSDVGPDGQPARWEAGFSWEAESCTQGGIVDPCDDAEKTLDPDDLEGSQTFDPFVVWGGHRCSAFGASETEREAKARRILAVQQHAQLEAEFWRGEYAQALATPADTDNAYLASAATDLAPGESSPLVYGLAALEEALAGCGGRGMVHMTTTMHTLLVQAQVLRRDGNNWLTPLDNIAVPGSGYDGSSPAGDVDATGSTAYAYITGMVDVRLGPVVVFGGEQSMKHRQNVVEVRAERTAAATFDPCCVFGINVNLCETFCSP